MKEKKAEEKAIKDRRNNMSSKLTETKKLSFENITVTHDLTSKTNISANMNILLPIMKPHVCTVETQYT